MNPRTRPRLLQQGIPKLKHRRKALTIKVHITMDANEFENLPLDKRAFVVAHEYMHHSLTNNSPTPKLTGAK